MDPEHVLREVIVNRLAPLLIGGPVQDLAQATEVARHALGSSADTDAASWLEAAQNIGCALTTLDSLRLSMDPDVSLAMRLRLRGNAVSLRRAAAVPVSAPRSRPPKAAAQPAEPAPPPPEAQADWARAMQKAAADLATQAAATPEEDRKRMLWRQVLTGVARELGHAPPPASPTQRRSELLRTTLMAGNPDFAIDALGGRARTA